LCLHCQGHNWSTLKLKTQWSFESLGAAHSVTNLIVVIKSCCSNCFFNYL
jgi:hypothetical protein